jgi:hypothetical protein
LAGKHLGTTIRDLVRAQRVIWTDPGVGLVEQAEDPLGGYGVHVGELTSGLAVAQDLAEAPSYQSSAATTSSCSGLLMWW